MGSGWGSGSGWGCVRRRKRVPFIPLQCVTPTFAGSIRTSAVSVPVPASKPVLGLQGQRSVGGREVRRGKLAAAQAAAGQGSARPWALAPVQSDPPRLLIILPCLHLRPCGPPGREQTRVLPWPSVGLGLAAPRLASQDALGLRERCGRTCQATMKRLSLDSNYLHINSHHFCTIVTADISKTC